MNLAWFNKNVFLSTSTSCPKPLSVSNPASSLIKSKGSPHTWVQIGTSEKVSELELEKSVADINNP